MAFSVPFVSAQLRPVLLCATAASALTSYFLFSRWKRVQNQQREKTQDVRQSDVDGMEDQDQEIFHSFCVSIPQISSGELERADRMFASSYSKWFSNTRTLVEVKLIHKSIYSGLESEHWWVISNRFYHIISLQLPPVLSACASAEACIKCTGTSISEAWFCLRAESTESSVQDAFLNTRIFKPFKCVHMDADGRVWYKESSDAQALTTPAFVLSSTPRGPPPGF